MTAEKLAPRENITHSLVDLGQVDGRVEAACAVLKTYRINHMLGGRGDVALNELFLVLLAVEQILRESPRASERVSFAALIRHLKMRISVWAQAAQSRHRLAAERGIPGSRRTSLRPLIHLTKRGSGTSCPPALAMAARMARRRRIRSRSLLYPLSCFTLRGFSGPHTSRAASTISFAKSACACFS